MHKQVVSRWAIGAVISILLGTSPALAQTFNSGSTGALGALNPPTGTTTITLPPDGILNYTTINIPNGATVQFQRNAANTPVIMLAQGTVTIAGIISVNGNDAIPRSGNGTGPLAGALGGPGGFQGGQAGAYSTANYEGAAGQGLSGGRAGILSPQTNTGDGSYGAPASFVGLIPLFGGSGGGGGSQPSSVAMDGGSGGGGGGAMLLASTTQITVTSTGIIQSNGGSGYRSYCDYRSAGAGSGGAIRLVAPSITNQGTIQALGGPNGCSAVYVGGPGRIRLEAYSMPFIAATNPVASIVTSPGPVTAASTPALTNLPTVRISAIGGVSSPATPAGTYATVDVTLPPGTTSPVPVTITATNTPPGTIFSVQVIPQFAAAPTVVSTAPSTGTCANSTATANLTLPAAQVAVLNAYSTFTLPCPP
ncbi:MAG TPA: hypothetical protein VJ692_07670 [Nitrospiraceae bacterium]|nr:hypothetical protein [Nitrospiraceae bacterium]